MVRLVNCVAYGVQKNYALCGMLLQLTYILSFIYCRLCVFTVTHPSVRETQITGNLPGCSKACSGLNYQTSAKPVHRYKCTEMHIYKCSTNIWIHVDRYFSLHIKTHIRTHIHYSLLFGTLPPLNSHPCRHAVFCQIRVHPIANRLGYRLTGVHGCVIRVFYLQAFHFGAELMYGLLAFLHRQQLWLHLYNTVLAIRHVVIL